jgi:hypothetical protein
VLNGKQIWLGIIVDYKFIIPNLDYCSMIYEIMEKLIKFSKRSKVNYEAEMIADYEHRELNEDGVTPKH